MITRACSDPTYVGKLRTNPIVDLRTREEEFRYRMVSIDCGLDGYSMAIDRAAETLAVYDTAGSVIGGITHRRILVLPDHRGQGLGAEILIHAFETGVMHPSTMNRANALTVAGRANRKSAHRIAVERAVRAGVEVDPEVLADYAEWMPAWSASENNHSSSGNAPRP
ncbi:GNAT family N-acetyltransferase [Rhizobium laguerreae]|uniref:GNAT family N-acetyltransferase n=1 Tax=Rhizobium laguerreae TaxID=1076926 RepID=UPI001C924C82|nr:GNAT family N-acetyltransferase [Rhizobium laguerreae]MBY3151433.1 GNAT family N-acetyltransferase [Rhizobium laguerreae]